MHQNLPSELLQSLGEVTGFERDAFESVHASGAQVTSVRLNPDKEFDTACSQLNITGNVPWCPYGRYLNSRPSFTMDPLLHGGAYYVQEASSMFLWHALQTTVGTNTAGCKVLDLCAAPGGKSTLLASYFKNALVVSNEVIRSRAAALLENITKWGSTNVIVTNNDPSDFRKLEGYFDIMVIDAPCSGSGLFRKDPSAIQEWSTENVMLCTARQQKILSDALPALKKDGVLIYSTCSYSREENEDILDWMLDHFPMENMRVPVNADWGVVESQSKKHEAAGYRFYPDKVNGEGFFIAAFVKKAGQTVSFRPPAIDGISRQEVNILNRWIVDPAQMFFLRQQENIIAIPLPLKEDLSFLQKNLYLRKAGITVGTIKGKDLVPDHDLALSHLFSQSIPSINLEYAQAILYLQKKEIQLTNTPPGWAVVRYCTIALGWVKVLQNRVNNYYPTQWRILKH